MHCYRSEFTFEDNGMRKLCFEDRTIRIAIISKKMIVGTNRDALK